VTEYPHYDPAVIETWCQDKWAHDRAFEPPLDRAGQKNTFVYACTPFTTGKAHMGHVRSYTIADACARRARSQGDAVLWAMGFDAFGLPNEIVAIENSVSPKDWVRACREQMTAQFSRLGLSVDWSRCFDTSDPEYYRWTQWVFLQFLQRGLVYRAEGIENWCDKCKAVLASLQVNGDGQCWRCGTFVRLACIPQWYIRFLPYAEELEKKLADLAGWDDAALSYQKALLGKTDGVEFTIPFQSSEQLTVFTPYPDAISRAAYIAVSPNHPIVERLVSKHQASVDLESQRHRGLRRDERSIQRVPAIKTDHTLRLPGSNRNLPIVVTPAVDIRFGGGAALGIPACDRHDAALADQLGIEQTDLATFDLAVLPHATSRYCLRDSSVSRQRGWGAPVPVIHCGTCGLVPVPEVDLPVQLPDDLMPTGDGSPLAIHPTFAQCKCPRCQGPARRDTDTLDVHFDSIWMLVPFCVPTPDRKTSMFSHPELSRWLPVAQVVCGVDQAAWWLNDRLFFKVLHDSGFFPHLSSREPINNLLMHEMVLSNGRKMSKSIGNVADPNEAIHRYGADALRLTVLRVDARKAFNWSEDTLADNHRFLSSLWNFVGEICSRAGSDRSENAAAFRAVLSPKTSAQCRAGLRKIALAYQRNEFHIVLKELKRLLETVRKAPTDVASPARKPNQQETLIDTMKSVIASLEPLAPHISYALARRMERYANSVKTTFDIYNAA
jgi:leucyl-tRNA synthetase